MPEKKKILVVRFSSIGDIVLTTPVIRALRKQRPEMEIHYLTKRKFLPVIKANPYIDKFHSIDHDIDEVVSDLRNEGYDHIVDLHKNIRTFGLKARLRVPSSAFNKLNLEKYLLVNFRINKLPDKHIVDRYFQAVEFLNVKNDRQGLDYFIPVDEENTGLNLPESHKNGYIGIVIGGNHYTKILPPEKVKRIISGIRKPVVLLGGEEDRERGEAIRSGLEDLVYNACGIYSINQSARLVRDADKILTNDTGLMHIAAAFGKEIISVWGNTVPEFGMYPYMPEGQEKRSVVFEVSGLSCRPCSKIGFPRCPRKHFRCMMDIAEDEIVEKFKV